MKTSRPHYEVTTLKRKPHLIGEIDRLSQEAWPEFLLHANIRHWRSLFEEFADFQILFCHATDTVLAVGHTIPLVWDGRTNGLPPDLDTIMERAMVAFRQKQIPTTLSALAAIISRNHQGKGLSSKLLRAMISLAAKYNLTSLIAPVRPTLKGLYPLIPMERYVAWVREDGAPFDPWIRVHWKLGAPQLAVAPNALVVTGTVSEWEKWTKMSFPESGQYVIPGAFQPVTIDREQNIGSYEEPNVWMRHGVQQKKSNT